MYIAWTALDWEKVYFTDETIAIIDSRHYQRWVQRPMGNKYIHDPKYTSHKQAHGPKINAWCSFSANSPGHILSITLLMNVLSCKLMYICLCVYRCR